MKKVKKEDFKNRRGDQMLQNLICLYWAVNLVWMKQDSVSNVTTTASHTNFHCILNQNQVNNIEKSKFRQNVMILCLRTFVLLTIGIG